MANTEQKSESVEGSTNKPSKRLNFASLVPKTRVAKALAVCSALLLVSVVAYAIYEQVRSDDIVVGNTRITTKDRDEYSKLVDELKKNSPELDLGGNAREVALNDLLLNAAFKLETAKRNQKLSDEDILAASGQNFKDDQEKQAFLINLRSGSKLILVRAENEAYKQRFGDEFIAKKDLLISRITFDTPLHARAPSGQVQKLYNDGAARLQRDIMPLMKNGASKEKIAQKSDVVLFDNDLKDDMDSQQYFKKLVLVTDLKKGYSAATQQFNDLDDTSYIRGNVGELYDTDEKIAQLKKVGDVTDVFASKTGNHMIIRLEAKTSGTYQSWDDFLNYYKEKYVSKKVSLKPVKSAVQASVSAGIRNFTSVGLQKAQAQAPGGCGEHKITIIGRAYDQTHHAFIKDATRFRLRAEGHAPNDCEGAHGDKTAQAGTGSPSNTIVDNCFSPGPLWKVDDHPNGYTFQKVVTSLDSEGWNNNNVGYTAQDVNSGIYHAQEGWPRWVNSDLNGKTVYIIFSYTKPVSWRLKVTTQASVNGAAWTASGQVMNIKRNQTVRWRYIIKNTGDDPTSAFQRKINLTGRTGSWTNQAALNPGESVTNPSNLSTTSITIPNSAALGTQYCGRGWADRTTESDASDNAGNDVCVKVSGSTSEPCNYATGWLPNPDTENCGSWGLDPQSSVSSGYVEQGGSVAFTHTINNYYNNGSGIRTADGFTRCVVINGACGQNIPASIPPGLYTVPDNEAATYTAYPSIPRGTVYCQAYSVGWERDDLANPANNIHSAKTSSQACTTVVGGTSSIRTNTTKPYIEPTETGTLTATINTKDFVGGGGWPGYTVNCDYNITANGSPIQSGSCGTGVAGNGDVQTVNWQRVAQPSDVGVQYCLNVFGAGTANANFFTGQPTSQSCFRVIARPYFKVYGGDVMAGCSITDASIIAWNKNGEGGSFNGAGASLAVFAQNVIKGFASGQTVPNSPGFATGPTNLSFANSNDSGGVATNVGAGVEADSNFGGNLKAGNCTSDYFGGMPSGDDLDTGGWPGVNEANLRPIQNFVINGNLSDMTSIAGETPTVAQGSRIRLYVKGDVYISKNILPSTAPNNTIENIPVITVVARNIYISPNVTQLYGTYVAQLIDGSGGNIYTCASGIGSPLLVTATGSNYNACRSQLVFTGSVVAKKIHLLRSWGSLYQDSGGFAPSSSAAAGGPGYNGAGEVFRFNPLVWQRESTGGPGDPPVTLYDFITTLPSDL